IESQMMTPLHGLGQESATELSGENGGNGMFEEYPHMAAVTGSRSLQIRWYAVLLARSNERQRILLPGGFVEVSSEKPTGLIGEQRINTDGLSSFKVQPNHVISQWIQSACLPVNLLAVFRPTGQNSAPILLIIRPVAPFTILHSPPDCVDVISTAEEAPKECY